MFDQFLGLDVVRRDAVPAREQPVQDRTRRRKADGGKADGLGRTLPDIDDPEIDGSAGRPE